MLIDVFLILIGKFLVYKKVARNIGKEIFMSSDGCNEKKPKDSHLYAPLISTPKKYVINNKIVEAAKKNIE